MPRVFRSHAGRKGHIVRAHYRALEQRLGPFDELARQYAATVATLYFEFTDDTNRLEEATGARDNGKGRRPSAAAIARLKKRAALTWGSYDSALQRLESLCAQQRKRQADPLAAVRAAVAEANGR